MKHWFHPDIIEELLTGTLNLNINIFMWNRNAYPLPTLFLYIECVRAITLFVFQFLSVDILKFFNRFMFISLINKIFCLFPGDKVSVSDDDSFESTTKQLAEPGKVWS